MPRYQDFTTARNEVFGNLRGCCSQIIASEVNIVREHFACNGIDLREGYARFVDANTVEIELSDSRQNLTADKFVIAVGTTPAKPDGIPFDDCTVITSDEVFELAFLPHSMIVVGGGVIGTEYASMLSALGVKVTIIEGRDSLLDFVDAEITEALQYHLRQNGMTLRLGEKVVKIEAIDAPRTARTADDRMAQATLESGKTLRADCLLYCIGRHGATRWARSSERRAECRRARTNRGQRALPDRGLSHLRGG